MHMNEAVTVSTQCLKVLRIVVGVVFVQVVYVELAYMHRDEAAALTAITEMLPVGTTAMLIASVVMVPTEFRLHALPVNGDLDGSAVETHCGAIVTVYVIESVNPLTHVGKANRKCIERGGVLPPAAR